MVGKLGNTNLQQVVGESTDSNLRQLAEDYDMLFLIPWGHYYRILR